MSFHGSFAQTFAVRGDVQRKFATGSAVSFTCDVVGLLHAGGDAIGSPVVG